MSNRRMLLPIVVLVAAARVAGAAEQARVDVVEDLNLPSAARALLDSGGPAVHYNPLLIARLPSWLALFAMLHEEAHVHLGHPLQRADGVVDAGAPVADPVVRRGQEFAADCAAASRLEEQAPGVLAFIIAYFRGLGDERPSEALPAGTERARSLAGCVKSSIRRIAH